MVREILKWPDRRLSRATAPVHVFDEGLRRVVDGMIETLLAADGLGLAAPQIGVQQRIILVRDQRRWLDSTGRWLDEIHVLINPRVLQAEGGQRSVEACLSVPGVEVAVLRHASVVIEAKNARGDALKLVLAGVLAACFEHEQDHLNGVTLPDHLPSWRRDVLRKKALAVHRRQV